VSELAERRLREFRSGAIRQLLQLETRARELRDELEAFPQAELANMVHEIADLHSAVLTVITYADRSAALTEVVS
jgi:hypothetical protein